MVITCFTGKWTVNAGIFVNGLQSTKTVKGSLHSVDRQGVVIVVYTAGRTTGSRAYTTPFSHEVTNLHGRLQAIFFFLKKNTT